jgi:hypothetical protein
VHYLGLLMAPSLPEFPLDASVLAEIPRELPGTLPTTLPEFLAAVHPSIARRRG